MTAGDGGPIDIRAWPTHNAAMHLVLTFLGFGLAAWALWRLLKRQESADPDFERRLQADERRARANRMNAARGSSDRGDEVPPTPPATP